MPMATAHRPCPRALPCRFRRPAPLTAHPTSVLGPQSSAWAQRASPGHPAGRHTPLGTGRCAQRSIARRSQLPATPSPGLPFSQAAAARSHMPPLRSPTRRSHSARRRGLPATAASRKGQGAVRMVVCVSERENVKLRER